MKTAFNFKKLIASTALITAAMGVSLSAEAGLYSSVFVTLGRSDTGASHDVVDYKDLSGNLIDTGYYYQDFFGFDSNHNLTAISFFAQSYGQADYGSLKAYSEGGLFNTIAPNDYNEPYFDEDGNRNEDGMPSWYGTGSHNRFSDALNISSSDNVAYIQLQLGLTGGINATGGNYTAEVYLGQFSTDALLPFTGPDPIFRSGESQTFNQNIWSNPIQLVNNQASFGIIMQTSFNHFIYPSDPDGETFYGISDFYHTLNVTSIVGFNAAGQQVNLTSAIGASGTHYTVAAPVNPGTSIPEPASLALLGIGLVGVGWARRRS